MSKPATYVDAKTPKTVTRREARSKSFRLAYNAEQKKEWFSICAERGALRKREDALIKQLRAHPDIKPVYKLMGVSPDNAPQITLGVNDCTVEVKWFESVTIDKADAAPTIPPRPAPTPFLDPKTENLLLNGKLLTDQQKRDMLVRLHPQLKAVFEQ